MQNPKQDESQAGIEIAGKKYQQSQICRWYHFNGRKWRGTKEILEEGEKGEWKSWIKTQLLKNKDHGIQSHHFVANRRKKKETGTDIIFLGSKITVDSDCSHELKDTRSLEEKLWQT